MVQKILIFRLLIFFSLSLYSYNSFSIEIIEGQAKVIDGDTIHIGKYKLRLHGIDSPEIEQTCMIDDKIWNCGLKSAANLKDLIIDKNIKCEVYDVDKYKRYVAECYLNNLNINQYMVRQGWAIAYRYYSTQFVKDEEMAAREKLGMWRGTFIEPYLFRKKNK